MSRGEAEPSQLALALPHEAQLSREDLVVSEANRAAVALLDAWPRWPAPVALLVGPAGAGKSHLARVLAERTAAPLVHAAALAGADIPALTALPLVVVEDADAADADTEAMFHLLNAARGSGTHVLVTARRPPESWTDASADLVSRLRAAHRAELAEPDDAMLRGVLVKLFADRQIDVDAGIVDYLAARMERSFASVNRLVDAVDRESLARRRPVTRPVAAAALARLADESGA